MRVLVVDDDVVARMMLMHLVDSCGDHAIAEAEDGADAWRQLQAGPLPEIVFCDLRMPHLSGLELLQRVRADTALAGLPFVLVSAASDGATLAEAAALGASGYIVKPFRQEDVRAQFARLMPATAAGADAGLDADETPQDVVRRLGIDGARLRLYLDALARQLQAAAHELPGLDPDAAYGRLARLRDGCATLGLHGAAAALAHLLDEDADDADDAHAHERGASVLALAGAAVARQAARAAAV